MLGHRGGGGEVAGNEATGQGGKNGQRGRAKDVDAQPNFFCGCVYCQNVFLLGVETTNTTCMLSAPSA